MAETIEVNKITSKNQITLPKPVRQALGVKPGNKLLWVIYNGVVEVRSADKSNAEDPVIASFLSFLARDMQRHPERLQPFGPELVARLQKLTKGVKVDLNERLTGPASL